MNSAMRKWRRIGVGGILLIIIALFVFTIIYDKPLNTCGGDPWPMPRNQQLIKTENPIRSLHVTQIDNHEVVIMGFLRGGSVVYTKGNRVFDWQEQCKTPDDSPLAQTSTVNDSLYIPRIVYEGTDGAGLLAMRSAPDSFEKTAFPKVWKGDTRIYDLLLIPEENRFLAMTWEGIQELKSDGWVTSDLNPPAGAPMNLHRCLSYQQENDRYFICASTNNGIVEYAQRADGNNFWVHVLGNDNSKQYNPDTGEWDILRDVLDNFTPNLRDIAVTPSGRIVFVGDAGDTGKLALFYYDPSAIYVEGIPTHGYNQLTGVAITSDSRIVVADYVKGAKYVGGDVITEIPTSAVAVGTNGRIYLGTNEGLIIVNS